MPSRDAITEQLERLGARVGGAVSKNTDLLLVGVHPGETKLSRAKELGTPMLSMYFFSYLQLDWERAGPRGLTSISDEFLTSLQLYMAIYVEELYGQWWRHRSYHTWRAFERARDALRRLLDLAWGTVLEGDTRDRKAAPGYITRPEGN